MAYFAAVLRTLTDATTVQGYWQMFVGILGWLDTPIGSFAYLALGIELLALLILSNSAASFQSLGCGHLALACAGIAALLLLFLVGLSAWTPHRRGVIEGIQGRYFYPIALLLLFACWTGSVSRIGTTLSFAFLTLTAASSLEFVIPRLLDRYYVH